MLRVLVNTKCYDVLTSIDEDRFNSLADFL